MRMRGLMTGKETLKDALRKLYGLEPFGKGTPTYHDGYFAASISKSYSAEEIESAKKELGIK